MPESYDLSQFDPNTFEHLVNLLALRILGPGHTGFCPGSDGGRDGYFEGEAPYPSETDRWSGTWYIQSKFHKPNLSKDPQKWLLAQIKEELAEFERPESRRIMPTNWIIATNIDPSGVPQTGSFDKARDLVNKKFPHLKDRFHIWGGRKILDFLVLNPQAGEYYRHFLTPGNILTEIYDQMKDVSAEAKTIIRFLILSQLDEQQYTKLEQAGSAADTRPGIHNLFIDLPFGDDEHHIQGFVTEWLARTSAKCHQVDDEQSDSEEWRSWNRHPSRARVWFIKGGPGQGKSTIGQYFCQIQRAALILQKQIQPVLAPKKALASEIRKVAEKAGFWTSSPRIPLYIELKDFAHWFGQHDKNKARGILTYLAEYISIGVEQTVQVGTLKRLIGSYRWFVVFDGLDEVPQDVKDAVALEVCHFVNDIAVAVNSDMLTICTSRPQGYSGQFTNLDAPIIELLNLSPEQALECAKPVIELDRPVSESKKSMQILTSAIQSPAVCELMTTPLQAHIMAVVVRDGERPPERRWKLFTNFYQVIKKREANRDLPDRKIAKLLREDEKLLKTVHNRLGFVLHAQAESSQGAQTKLSRDEFKLLVTGAVSQMVETNIDEQVDILMEATTDRLVLVSTPDDGDYVRFDVRQLQEFFAAEFIYESASVDELRDRLQLIAGDAHWREVTHFLLSALIENDRKTELTVAIQVLENLNEGDEHIRLLNKRLARGSILVARLLQEGVLEQDKRIRQQFRNSLKPLATSTKANLLFTLTQINQSNSKSWLYSFLVSCLKESNYNESIGAAIILTQILPDNIEYAEDIKYVTKFLKQAPSEYLSCLLTSSLLEREFYNERQARPKSNHAKQWFLKTIGEILLGNQWLSLSIDAFAAAVQIITVNHNIFFSTSNILELSNTEQKFINLFVSENNIPFESSDIDPVQDYEFIKVVKWKSHFSGKISATELSEDMSFSCDFVQITQLLFRYAKSSSRSNLIEIFNWFNIKKCDLIYLFFSSLNLSLPMNNLISSSIIDNIASLKSIDDQEFHEEIDKNLKIRVIPEPSKKNLEIVLWKKVIDKHPHTGVYLWTLDEAHRILRGFNGEEVLSIILDKVIERPSLVLSKPSVWGKLLKQVSTKENEFRKIILSNISENVIDEDTFPGFTSFKLNLPLEANLIPHLLNAMLTTQRIFWVHREIHREQHDVIKKMIFEMVPNTMCLQQIYKNTEMGSRVQAASLIMLLLHPESDEKITNVKELIVDFYTSKIGHWYIKALSVCLCLLTTEQDLAAQWIMNKLIDTTRTDYESRKYLESVLALWRESSHAPIQSAGVQARWLAGEG
ncbi:hypothetical protein [Chamaesiphon sp. OTE_75_metabat_556]|uniref:NACHT domain-containing protein n=1 Tax=Chamaesiphon sp. OTE_75_metabat_556 TaxID=2964692 RepID=UPI00286CD9B2|nr:hypothetical protein [Chamaesiphon sp. OTE_75_metabat_556]